jgi:hypothetical protein
VGIEPDEVSRRGAGDHGGTRDPPDGSLVGEALDHAVDESADLTEEVAVVAEEDAQHPGGGWCPGASHQGQLRLVCHALRDGSPLRAA